MGWLQQQREQAERTLDALDDIRVDVQALRTVPAVDRGYVSELQRFPALRSPSGCAWTGPTRRMSVGWSNCSGGCRRIT
jgi:hypothetical protein